ncbi:MAG TPA: Glu/Leu/Phe/Val dehydrogenase dimerization domain-containing protein [Rhizomicrobium sp.]|jgi:leucine dehydrogenase|nr:Glu/Leu/Phe/Val dehydrogenase dimerization domain-containing protein [Rhizomicrobium sp.]
MNVFDSPDFDRHETVAFFDDAKSGLKAIIAIHSTAMGPACGGTRMYPYATPDAALTDALRLARGMSYKNAIADLPLGGGKAVIIGDPAVDKSAARFAAYAEAVNTLGGRYVTAMDVGILPADMPVIARGTKFIAGYDQPGKAGGDSGPATALGVFSGLQAAVRHRLGVDTTKGLRVAIQGLGKVGMGVARRLHAEGATLIVADTNPDAVKLATETLGATAMAPDAIVTAECDVLSPNALGAILNDRTIPHLHARVVAGGANNQLARDAHGAMLRDQGILYAPDYVINGGGIIRVAAQIENWSDAEVERRVLGIADTLRAIFVRAAKEGEATSTIADRMAVERIAQGKKATAKAAE